MAGASGTWTEEEKKRRELTPQQELYAGGESAGRDARQSLWGGTSEAQAATLPDRGAPVTDNVVSHNVNGQTVFEWTGSPASQAGGGPGMGGFDITHDPATNTMRFSDVNGARAMRAALNGPNSGAVQWNDKNISKDALRSILNQSLDALDRQTAGQQGVPVGGGAAPAPAFQEGPNIYGRPENISEGVRQFTPPSEMNAQQPADVMRLNADGSREMVLTPDRRYAGTQPGRPGEQVEVISGTNRAMYGFDNRGNPSYNPMFEAENRNRQVSNAVNTAEGLMRRGTEQVGTERTFDKKGNVTGERPVMHNFATDAGNLLQASGQNIVHQAEPGIREMDEKGRMARELIQQTGENYRAGVTGQTKGTKHSDEAFQYDADLNAVKEIDKALGDVMNQGADRQAALKARREEIMRRRNGGGQEAAQPSQTDVNQVRTKLKSAGYSDQQIEAYIKKKFSGR